MVSCGVPVRASRGTFPAAKACPVLAAFQPSLPTFPSSLLNPGRSQGAPDPCRLSPGFRLPATRRPGARQGREEGRPALVALKVEGRE